MQNPKLKEIIFLNGKFISQKEAKLSVLTPGFLYGWGIFETMRAYQKKIVYFDTHLERIQNASKIMEIKFPYALKKLKKIIQTTLKINGFTDAYVRLTLSKSKKGTDTLIMVKKYQPPSKQKYRKGFSAYISSFRQDENSFLARVKTISRLLYELAYQEAKARGFDEAIMFNQRGYICEGSRSNLFFVKNNELFTPALTCGCLAGITRHVIFDLAKKAHLKLYEGKFTPQEVSGAEEAFLTNSLIGVMPLTLINKQSIGTGKITRFFLKEYNRLLKNGT
jgi:branched-subunit amino acid aminotransferase/4-amino-4-deoxychorismate lyase